MTVRDLEHAGDVRNGLAQLREGFLDRVAERCMAIDAIVSAETGSDMAEANRRIIAHHAHKTAGVAATFGFPRLGALALETEAAMTGTGPASEWRKARGVVERFLDEMERVLDATT